MARTGSFPYPRKKKRGRPKGTPTKPRALDLEAIRPVLRRMHKLFKGVPHPLDAPPTNDELIVLLQDNLDEWLDWKKIKDWASSDDAELPGRSA